MCIQLRDLIFTPLLSGIWPALTENKDDNSLFPGSLHGVTDSQINPINTLPFMLYKFKIHTV